MCVNVSVYIEINQSTEKKGKQSVQVDGTANKKKRGELLFFFAKKKESIIQFLFVSIERIQIAVEKGRIFLCDFEYGV